MNPLLELQLVHQHAVKHAYNLRLISFSTLQLDTKLKTLVFAKIKLLFLF